MAGAPTVGAPALLQGPCYIQPADSLQGRRSFSQEDEVGGGLWSDDRRLQSAERRLIPAQCGAKLNILEPPQHAPRLKVHRESKQPQVYQPTFAIK